MPRKDNIMNLIYQSKVKGPLWRPFDLKAGPFYLTESSKDQLLGVEAENGGSSPIVLEMG